MRFNFAIIGGGLTAAATLCQFVKRVWEKAAKGQLDPSKIQIQIIDAGMANGIVQATSMIADDLVNYLNRIITK
jgi:NADH dehydrogenase FAD-containing subunit